MKMKTKYISLEIGLMLIMCIIATSASGQCLKGKQFDCIWGCGNFIDTNNDGFCDYSEVTEKNIESQQSSKNDTLNRSMIKHHSPMQKQEVAEDLLGKQKTQEIINADTTPKPAVLPSTIPEKPPEKRRPAYSLIFLSSLTIGLYLLTFLLYRLHVIKKITHRKIWNVILLLSFIISCLFGLLLVFQINYNILRSIYGTILYWHVEVGIVMTLVALFHIFWHLKYFKRIFAPKKCGPYQQ